MTIFQTDTGQQKNPGSQKKGAGQPAVKPCTGLRREGPKRQALDLVNPWLGSRMTSSVPQTAPAESASQPSTIVTI